MVLPSRLVLRVLVLGAGTLPMHGGSQSTLRSWHLVDGRHWQIEANPLETAAQTDGREKTRGACPEGMVDVEGAMKMAGPESIDDLQEATCTQWIDRRYPERCATYDRAAWLRVEQALRAEPMRFCIDRFEYPNLGSCAHSGLPVPGPAVMSTQATGSSS